MQISAEFRDSEGSVCESHFRRRDRWSHTEHFVDMPDAGRQGVRAFERAGVSSLRLGVCKLPEAEVAVIRTIIQLYATDGTFAWTLVGESPYDALLVDASVTQAESSELTHMVSSMRVFSWEESSKRVHALERPIRADRLKRWLDDTELALRQAQSSEMVADEQSMMKVEVSNSVRFMLLRWPSALLLRNDLDKVHMAILLSQRALNAIELADISGLPLSQCIAFIQVLRVAGALELHVTPGAMARSQEAGEFKALRRGGFGRSFINGFRRRLGLGEP